MSPLMKRIEDGLKRKLRNSNKHARQKNSNILDINDMIGLEKLTTVSGHVTFKYMIG